MVSPNSTQNATFNDYCSLKITQPLNDKHLQYLVGHPFAVMTCCKRDA